MKQDNLLWTSKCECGANTLPLVLSISGVKHLWEGRRERERRNMGVGEGDGINPRVGNLISCH